MLVGMEYYRPNIPDAVPKASTEPLPEIAEFLEPFAPLFRRSQSRHSLERYITGLLTDLDRKNCDTIAAAVAGTSTERLQHLLTDADWDSQELDGARVRSLSQKSPKGGVLILDDTSVPKQGKSSVGVARQYCGAVGKRANCQVLLSAQYVADEPESSRPLHWPVCARLSLGCTYQKRGGPKIRSVVLQCQLRYVASSSERLYYPRPEPLFEPLAVPTADCAGGSKLFLW
jgi:hypothetical protein